MYEQLKNYNKKNFFAIFFHNLCMYKKLLRKTRKYQGISIIDMKLHGITLVCVRLPLYV